MPKAGTGGCWLELPLSTDRFATEDHCTKDECRSPHLASRLMIPHCVAPRCATDTYLGCIPAKRPDRTYGAGPQPCSTGALLDMAPCACDSGSLEGRRHIWGRCADPRCNVELAASYECIRSCDDGPRHRHARALRAGRRPPPLDPHMAAFPLTAQAPARAAGRFCHPWKSRLASNHQCVIMGLGHARRPTGRRQAIALRCPDSQDLPVSFPLMMEVTMYLASSGSVPSDRRGRREITFQRSGDRWATLNDQGCVECLTGSKSRHRVTKSQGVSMRRSQA